MKNQITDWFKKPFPTVESAKDKLLISLGSGVVVVGILLIIRPFGIESYKGKFFFLSGFGIISFLVTALNLFLIPLALRGIINNSNWTTGKNFLAILWILLNISLVNYFYGEHLVSETYKEGLENLNRTGIVSWITMTFSVGVIPVVFALYFIEKRLFRKNWNMAENFSKEMKGQSTLKTKKQIELKSSKDTSLIVSSPDLICVKAEGNYTSVFWHDESGVKKEMIRLSLVGFLKKTNSLDNIIRCHKSYIVNLDKVLSFHGNARSVTIRLDGLDFNVPVSRSFPREKLTIKADLPSCLSH